MFSVVRVKLDARGRDCRGMSWGARGEEPLFYVLDDSTAHGIHLRAKDEESARRAATVRRSHGESLIASRNDQSGKAARKLFIDYLAAVAKKPPYESDLAARTEFMRTFRQSPARALRKFATHPNVRIWEESAVHAGDMDLYPPRSGNMASSRSPHAPRRDTLTVFYAPDGIWRLDDVDGTDERPFPAGWYWMHPDYNTGTGPFHSSQEAEANARAVLLGTSWAKGGHHIVTMPPAPYSQAVRRRMAAYP